jgi:hypothetical protein
MDKQLQGIGALAADGEKEVSDLRHDCKQIDRQIYKMEELNKGYKKQHTKY